VPVNVVVKCNRTLSAFLAAPLRFVMMLGMVVGVCQCCQKGRFESAFISVYDQKKADRNNPTLKETLNKQISRIDKRVDKRILPRYTNGFPEKTTRQPHCKRLQCLHLSKFFFITH
jgi:hypothetical protein